MKKCSLCDKFKKPSLFKFIIFQVTKLFGKEKYYVCPGCNKRYQESEKSIMFNWLTRGICIALVVYAIVWVPSNISQLLRLLIFILSSILILFINTAIYWTYVKFSIVDSDIED